MKKAPAVEPGQGAEGDFGKAPSRIAPLDHNHQPDPRAAILLRAAARYDLLRAGEIDLGQAFSADFVDDILTATGACPCQCDQHRHFDRIARELRKDRLRKWRRSRR